MNCASRAIRSLCDNADIRRLHADHCGQEKLGSTIPVSVFRYLLWTSLRADASRVHAANNTLGGG